MTPVLHAVLQRSEGAVAERLGSGGEGAAAERLGSGGRARLRWSAGAPRPGPCGMRGPGTLRDEVSPLNGSPLPGSVPWTRWALAHTQGPSGVRAGCRVRVVAAGHGSAFALCSSLDSHVALCSGGLCFFISPFLPYTARWGGDSSGAGDPASPCLPRPLPASRTGVHFLSGTCFRP